MAAQQSELASDRSAGVARYPPDDRFVPIRAGELIAALAEDAERFGFDPAGFRPAADALEDVIEQEAAAFARELADLYAAFNPDRDTWPLQAREAVRTPEACAELSRRLVYLLEKANFERLSQAQIEAAVRAANSHGLRVRLHPERVDDLAIWVRGRGSVERDHRTWRHPVRGESRTLSVFRRLVVVARLRDDPHVLIKMFKDIPVEDVEALLPHAEIGMSWRDRVLLVGGGAGTLGSTASKVFGLLKGVAVLTSLLWVVLVGAAMLTYRTFMGYRRARTNRDSQRTRHLYYQNLSNNGAALHTLVSMIAQEELKEAVLAYAFCHTPGERSWTPADLGTRVAGYLSERFSVRVDFDAPDAVESLTRLNLFRSTLALRVVPCHEAEQRLRQHWSARRSADYHRSMVKCLRV
ncbi:MAG: DUF3754 domain-containing protein [Phycisphaerae bacterium]